MEKARCAECGCWWGKDTRCMWHGEIAKRKMDIELNKLTRKKLLQPGWGGELSDEEGEYIQAQLMKNDALSLRWGFRPSQKTRPADCIRRVAMQGNPDNWKFNRGLVRPSSTRAKFGPESRDSRTVSEPSQGELMLVGPPCKTA
jgi:hypothetical protein